MPVLEAHDLHKSYTGGDGGTINVLSGVDLTVSSREMVAIVGASGAGKSTLLHVLGALDKPSRGYVVVGGDPINGLNEEQLAGLRNRSVGFVFQFHHLLREFTALENVMMPALIAGTSDAASSRRAEELLTEVGLAERMKHKPSELSGGEAQRVAVARAFMMQPSLILADEPTGNLDEINSMKLFDMMLTLAQRYEQTFLIATHNLELAKRATRHMHLEKGVLSEAGT
jgi:lipoprotein-releasing system ATP-binding protein